MFLKHKASTLRDVLGRVSDELAASGCDSPRVDAEHIVGHALGLSRAELSAALDRQPEPAQIEAIDVLVERRRRREPLQYVLGEWGFRRLVLTVDRRALIPRPETEIVVERCLALLAGRARPRVLDVGTGSGAIGLAIADEHPGAQVTGIDISRDALSLARENAERTGVAVELLRHDLGEGLPAGPWELVVSNPPYVAPADRVSLAPEVRDWEPALALFGRDETEAIARGALGVLVEGGALVLEVGDGDAGDVARLLGALGYRDVRVTRDLAGRERVVEGARP